MELRYARGDHAPMVAEGAMILAADGKDEAYRFLQQTGRGRRGEVSFLEGLKIGAVSADGMIEPRRHFHHPFSHRGFWNHRNSAADVAEICYRRAKDHFRRGNIWDSAYNLGQALHMLQDAHVPHHAALLGVFMPLGLDPYGHFEYENWLEESWREYIVSRGGVYRWKNSHYHPDYGTHHTSSERVYHWVDQAAAVSFQYVDLVNSQVNPKYRRHYPHVASILIPHTLRWTAGFINKFVWEVTAFD